MAKDLLIYADSKRQIHAAGSLILLGAEQFKQAKVIKDIDRLKAFNAALQNNTAYDRASFAYEFVWHYLIDCIRILIFFEGYMKAELIKNDFCVHNINKEDKYSHFSSLLNQQRKRPVSLKEIANTESFIISSNPEAISHGGLKATTLSINVLLCNEYRKYYKYDDFILESIRYFNVIRNSLHFNISAEFELSNLLIERLERMDAFVNDRVAEWMPPKQ